MPEVRCTQCVSTQTDIEVSLDPEWDKWIQTVIYEDDELMLNASDPQGQRDEGVQRGVPGSPEIPMPEGRGAARNGDTYSKECARCREALGLKRPHPHGKSTSQNVLSADLSGPHPEAVGTKFKYMLVAVFNGGPKTKNLPFVRGLTTKSSQEVVTGIKSVIAELNSIMGEQIVVRFHTDAGGEFLNEAMKSLLTTMEIHQTKTAGHDPKANGRAERYVGIIKRQATSYLMHSKLPLKFWYWAANQAADLYRKTDDGGEAPSRCTDVWEPCPHPRPEGGGEELRQEDE